MWTVLVLICHSGYGQCNVNELFRDFSKQADANKVRVGKMTMSIAGLFTDTMGVDGVDILSFDECSGEVKEKFNNAVRNLKDPAYETMVNSNENGKRTRVMIRIKDDVIHELVVLTSGDEASMVRIRGKIKKSDIERLANEHS